MLFGITCSDCVGYHDKSCFHAKIGQKPCERFRAMCRGCIHRRARICTLTNEKVDIHKHTCDKHVFRKQGR